MDLYNLQIQFSSDVKLTMEQQILIQNKLKELIECEMHFSQLKKQKK